MHTIRDANGQLWRVVRGRAVARARDPNDWSRFRRADERASWVDRVWWWLQGL